LGRYRDAKEQLQVAARNDTRRLPYSTSLMGMLTRRRLKDRGERACRLLQIHGCNVPRAIAKTQSWVIGSQNKGSITGCTKKE
jgi:hypothetical protein